MAASNPDRIRLTGMRFSATHGVYDFERKAPQPFVIDLTCDLIQRPVSDDLATTVNYAELVHSVAGVVNGEPVNLIETLAERIASSCLTHPLIASVEVTVHKPEADLPVELADVAVTIHRSRIR